MHAVRLIKVVPHTCFFSLGNSLPSPRGGREYYARFTLPDRAHYRRAPHRLVGIVRFVSSVHPYLSKSSVSDQPPIHEDGRACDSLRRRTFIPYSFFKDSIVRIRTGVVSASCPGIIQGWYLEYTDSILRNRLKPVWITGSGTNAKQAVSGRFLPLAPCGYHGSHSRPLTGPRQLSVRLARTSSSAGLPCASPPLQTRVQRVRAGLSSPKHHVPRAIYPLYMKVPWP